jgi:hypothetical protein
MSDLFHREATVVVDALRVEGLRVQFKVEKTLGKEPNTLDLTLTNLAEATRAKMQKRHAKVVLLAGYRGNVSQIFAGDARTTDHVRKGADWETRVQCGDGERAYTLSRVNESFAPGTRAADVVARLAERLGVGAGNLKKQLGKARFPTGLTQYTAGYSSFGKASAELDRVLSALGLTWSIQDGALQILEPTEAAEEPAAGQAPILSPDTGLVGSPEHGAPDKKGRPSVVKAKALLMPGLKPGGVVELRVRARDFSGQYRVTKVVHTGDTAGNAWHSDLELHQR